MKESPHLQKARRAILWLATEDFCGLWEVLWQLNSLLPGLVHEERLTLGRAVVSELLSNGLIHAFAAVEPYDDLSPLPLNQALALCREDVPWNEPVTGTKTVRISASEKGETVYREMIS